MSMSKSLTLKGLNLVVADMESSLAFYRLLGVDIPDESVWRTETGGHHVGINMPKGADFDLDSETLAKQYDAGWTPNAPRCLVSFAVGTRQEVDIRYTNLTSAGYKGLQEPYDAFWGARYAIVEDPDGIHVGLMSPRDSKHQTRPPNV